MTRRFIAACVQTNTGPDVAANLAATAALVEQAAGRGANFVALPEMVGFIEAGRKAVLAKAEAEEGNRVLHAYSDQAHRAGVWLLVGSLAIAEGDKVANRSYLIDASGRIVTSYDKIHMFDVDVGDGQTYRESATYRAGGEVTMADLPWGRLGMTICYDVRFPNLYRYLAQAGADFLSVPSAFTRTTGEAHWHVLLRARAIETGCYVFAPAQCGQHAGGRETYGHSLIVDPWGMVLADGGTEPGIVLAEIDAERVADARRRIPSLTQDRPLEKSAGAALEGQLADGG